MAGRPRDAELERRLLAAAWAVVTGEGYDAVTFAKVAAHAGAHRTDVYRRWASKAQLVTDAVVEHLPPIPDVDTGALHTDLRRYVEDLAALWSQPWMDGVVGLIADLRRDPVAGAAFQAIAGRNSRPVLDAIARAVRRGELTRAADRPTIGHLLEGPLMHRRFFGGPPVTPEDLDVIATSAMRVLAEPVAVTTKEPPR